MLRRYWKKKIKNPSAEKPEKNSVSVFEVSDSTEFCNIAFLIGLFAVCNFFVYALVAWLKYPLQTEREEWW